MDDFLLLLINGNHNEFWDVFMMDISWKFTWVPLYLVMAFMVFRSMAWRKALLFLIIVALAITIADQCGAHVIRPLACRLRPTNVANPISEQIHLVNGYRSSQYGMPSCHAANSVALLMFMYMMFRSRRLLVAMALWVASFCYSRMYLGVHYPTDLLVGILVGVGAGYVAYLIYKWLYARFFKEQYHPVVLRCQNYPIYAMIVTYILIAIQSIQFS